MTFRSSTTARRARIRLALETLEPRDLLAGLPTGAMPDDTAEYLLGDVVVSVVLMESTSSLAPHDTSTETWTAASIQDVKTKVDSALAWWKSMLQRVSPAMAADLNFYVDYTHADAPVATGYEPINRISNDFQFWMYDFLNKVGYNQTQDFSEDIRAFNHAQRLASAADQPVPADWAFTVIVVNSTVDGDDAFAAGGTFSRAFAFAGGRMTVIPSDRPAYSYAHEMGHMFWAMDEYSGNSSLAQRGYYNTPNSNAPHAGYTQLPSIMANGELLETAWTTQQQAAVTLEMIGWRDADNDGIFDVLDVPFDLSGVGSYDPTTERYRFRGQSSVRTLPNLNPSGLQNDITINEISRAEYRIDGGPWQTAAIYNQPAATLDFEFAVAPSANLVEIRTIDAATGAASPIFQGSLARADAAPHQGINGFVFNDLDDDGQFDVNEPGLSGWTLRLVGANGQMLPLEQTYEPDDYAPLTILNSANSAVALLALGGGTDGTVTTLASSVASTGTQVFGTFDANLSSWTTTWDDTWRRLRARFASPVSRVSLDAIANSAGDYGRLEAYDSSDRLLARFTTGAMTSGQVTTMTIERPTNDIAYVVARGHAGSEILLDHLQFGPEPSVVSAQAGDYLLTSLPAGTYTVQAVPPSWFVPDGPLPANQEVVLGTGDSRVHVDFAAHSVANIWQNASNPVDVNNDGFVSPIDALLVINDLNANGSRQLPSPGIGPDAPPPFLDVNGDTFVAPLDALFVINTLNAAGNSEGPAGSSAGSQRGGSAAGDADGEDHPAAMAPAPLPRGRAFSHFTARGRTADVLAAVPAPALPEYSIAVEVVDDALATDVYRAWVRSRDAAADQAELHAPG